MRKVHVNAQHISVMIRPVGDLHPQQVGFSEVLLLLPMTTEASVSFDRLQWKNLPEYYWHIHNSKQIYNIIYNMQ